MQKRKEEGLTLQRKQREGGPHRAPGSPPIQLNILPEGLCSQGYSEQTGGNPADDTTVQPTLT